MDKYAVVGNPVSHSKSPEIHQMFAEQCKQNMTYERILSTPETFGKDLDAFFKEGLGLNVTLPFKTQALAYADELSETAGLAGAANTLIKRDNKILADNTDGVGLLRDITLNQGCSLKDKKLLIIGAGGAARGVMKPLIDAQPAQIVVANRTLSRAQELVEHFASFFKLETLSLEQIKEQHAFDCIINASSAGLAGQCPDLPEQLDNSFCYDMIYGDEPTSFIQQATQRGCQKTSDGLGMLVEQAAQSFFLWRGLKPDTSVVIEAMRKHL